MPFWQKIKQHIISYFTKLRNRTIKKHIEHEQEKPVVQFYFCSIECWSLNRQNLSSCYKLKDHKLHVVL